MGFIPNKSWVANGLTLANLAFGLIAMVVLFEHQGGKVHWWVAGLMAASFLCDFLDGFAARALRTSSPIGKELDSLADLASFGILPGMLVYHVLKTQLTAGWGHGAGHLPGFAHALPSDWVWIFPLIGLVIPLFSALRLAKFNVDTRQSFGFLGLPTPANALFFLSIFLAHGEQSAAWKAESDEFSMFPTPIEWLFHPMVLPILVLVFSILLVTEIPLLAMKFKEYSWKGNWPRYALLLISVTLLALWWYKAAPLIIVLYFLFSFIDSKIHASQ
jgi:CDP-diacylglycerol--serine O-phosphatidyltransferase